MRNIDAVPQSCFEDMRAFFNLNAFTVDGQIDHDRLPFAR
jgi:hypothetical protein